jgi:hypothetical protein
MFPRFSLVLRFPHFPVPSPKYKIYFARLLIQSSQTTNLDIKKVVLCYAEPPLMLATKLAKISGLDHG